MLDMPVNIDRSTPITIDKKTNVPLFAVLASLPFIVGAMLWLTNIDSKASAAQEGVEDLKPLVKNIAETLIRMDERERLRYELDLKSNQNRGTVGR